MNSPLLVSPSRTLHRMVVGLSFFAAASAMAADSRYDAEVRKWKTHEDVAQWLKSNFVFDKDRQSQVLRQLKETGPDMVLTRKPETLFENRNGYCRDSAGFAKDALNRISPDYKARYIFVKNSAGPTNHWVTGFMLDHKLYVLDYGAGKHWEAIEGVHGPYDSLEGYKDFLASLKVPGFVPEFVKWRDIPGQVD